MSGYDDAIEMAPAIEPYDLEQENDKLSHTYEDYVRKPSDYENEIANLNRKNYRLKVLACLEAGLIIGLIAGLSNSRLVKNSFFAITSRRLRATIEQVEKLFIA